MAVDVCINAVPLAKRLVAEPVGVVGPVWAVSGVVEGDEGFSVCVLRVLEGFTEGEAKSGYVTNGYGCEV